MNKKELVKTLEKKGYDKFGSWALYDVPEEKLKEETIKKSDLSFQPFQKNLFQKINTNGLFVALNWSGRGGKTESWENFHDTDSRSQDYKIPYMVIGTPYEGSYMTDLFKNFPETKSSKVLKAIKLPENKQMYEESIRLFQEEVDLIQPQKIFCFGNATYNFLNKLKGKDLNISDSVEMIKISHYSCPTLSKARCKEEIRKTLSEDRY